MDTRYTLEEALSEVAWEATVYGCSHVRIATRVVSSDGKLYCTSCQPARLQFPCNLGSTVDKWTHRDKKTDRLISHKITKGKEWEIENRRLSRDDNHTPINVKTGKEAQY